MLLLPQDSRLKLFFWLLFPGFFISWTWATALYWTLLSQHHVLPLSRGTQVSSIFAKQFCCLWHGKAWRFPWEHRAVHEESPAHCHFMTFCFPALVSLCWLISHWNFQRHITCPLPDGFSGGWQKALSAVLQICKFEALFQTKG